MATEDFAFIEIPDVDEAFEAAVAHHQAGRIADAAALYRNILRVDAEHPGALYLLGGMAYEQGDYQETYNLVARALLEAPDDPDALHLLGLSALPLDKLSEARDSIEQALALRPHYPEAHHNLGRVYTQQGDFQAAIECYEKALALQPGRIDSLTQLADAQLRLGQVEQSIDTYRAIIAQHPNRADIHCNLGAALHQHQQLDDAIVSFRQALLLDPDSAAAYHSLGNALMDQNKPADALKYFEKVLGYLPHRADVLCSVGSAQARLSNAMLAEQYFRRATEVQPDYFDAHQKLGSTLKSLNRLPEAIAEYERCVQLDPGNAEVRHMLASLRGDNPDTAPRDYVRDLFDQYAKNFEDSLVGKLDYRIPALMRATIDQLCMPRFNHALDLGCGTGLVGEQIKDIASDIRGVDLAPKMLQEAAQKNIYSNLYAEDIVEFLIRSQREYADYDLIIAADVFIYVGNLERVFHAARQVFTPRGLFVFSVEELLEGTYQLRSSGRYAHSTAYIHNLAAEAGFIVKSYERCVVRTERDSPIFGNLFVLIV